MSAPSESDTGASRGSEEASRGASSSGMRWVRLMIMVSYTPRVYFAGSWPTSRGNLTPHTSAGPTPGREVYTKPVRMDAPVPRTKGVLSVLERQD